MKDKHPPFVTIYLSTGGWKAVLMVWEKDMRTYLHYQTGMLSYNSPSQAMRYALQWGHDEELDVRLSAKDLSEFNLVDFNADWGSVPCYMCGRQFQPDPVKMQEWGNSGRPYEPTDWECPVCWQASLEEAKDSEPDIDD